MIYKQNNRLFRLFGLIVQAIKGEAYDYTNGSIKIAIVLLAIPMMLELCLESVFAVVDMYVVGHLSNANEAATTVGLTEAVLSLIYTLGIGLSTGVTAIVARRVGEGNHKEAARSGAQAILFSIFVSIIITILGVYFASDILRLMGASEAVVVAGTDFTRIMLASSPAIILLFLINGIYRGAGNAAISMRSLWLASGLNIILCPLLTFGYGFFPEMGLTGAALATALGRSTGVAYQLWHLFHKRSVLKFQLSDFRWHKPTILALLDVSMPATFQFFVQSGSWILLTYIVSFTGGTEASAGYQIAIRNVVFFILPVWGLSNAAATLVGQNLGAGKPERAEQSTMLVMWYNTIFMTFVTFIFLFFSKQIIGIFTNHAVVASFGTSALKIIGAGYIFYGIGIVMIQALNGAGDTKTPTFINILCFWCFQVPLAWCLAKYYALGPIGAFIAIPVAECALAIVAFYFFKRGKWKFIKV